MYMIRDKSENVKHWSSALDEGYKPNPHIDLAISINKQVKKWKLRLSRDNREIMAVAAMLRDTADSIEKDIKIFEARYRSLKELSDAH